MAKSLADELMERRASLINKAQEIAQKGVTEDRDLSHEEQTSFDQMIAEAGKLHERAKAIAEGEERAHELENSFRKTTGREPERRDRTADSELGAWMRSARIGDGFDLAPVRGAERRAIMRNGEQRAMSATGGVDQDGVYGQLWEYAVDASQILQAGVDIINTADGNTLPFPKATVHSSTSTATANTALTSSDSTLTTVDLSVSKDGFLTLVPTELVQDVTFDLEGYIARNAGRQLGLTVAATATTAAVAGFTTAGSTGPTGTTTDFGSQDTVGEGSDLLVDLYHSVIAPYRTSAAWLMADPTAAVIRKLKTSTGDMVWQPALTVGDPDMILGKPVYFDPNLDSPGVSNKTVFFGDWSALKVRIAGGMRFERSNEYAFDADQVAFRAVVRSGAVALDPNAVKYFVHSAT